MARLLKIAILTVTAFVGAVLMFAGVHFGRAAPHMPGPTLFGAVRAGADSDGLSYGTSDTLFDKDLMPHRTGAVAISAFGASTFFWAVALMRNKREHDSTT
jgi:hypothetical protein